MGRRNKQSNMRYILAETANEMLSRVSDLSASLRDGNASDREKELCKRAAVFVGGLAGKALIYSVLGKDERKDVYSSMRNMERFFSLAMARDKRILFLVTDNYLAETKQAAWSAMEPLDAENFEKELERAQTDRLAAMECILKLGIAVDEYNDRAYKTEDPQSFCSRCEANQITAQVLPRLEEILLPKIKGRQLAAALDRFASDIRVSTGRAEKLRWRADKIREFVELFDEADELENWSDICKGIAGVYACAKMESTALIVLGILHTEDVARAFDVPKEEISDLAGSLAMKQYVGCTCAHERRYK